ncbi:1-phosphatidylinositol-3-phosphate 5-kinase FAB1B [Acorus calamus]|uniref:Phosphatidylinositol 3-phosphate 5-kinase type III n=1 Tax=Acorus calamus TaxID=4465 RepID=A0AAV9E4N4_ACOCL|nr:1-phosphatidylinositol-3-phosphate 5-kinase FAB1B [Acorus calamus]
MSEAVGIMRSFIPRRSEPPPPPPPNLSRDFWMPDHSCRVCYECDAQFTVFNRRHHCRLCGRVFCAKCTLNSVPAVDPCSSDAGGGVVGDMIRVCNYCFKRWEHNGMNLSSSSPCLSPSLSTTSLASSTMSGGTGNSCGIAYCASVGHQRVSPSWSMEPETDKQEVGNPSPNQYEFCMNRSDDEDEEYSAYHSDSETRHFLQSDDCYGNGRFNETDHDYGCHNVHTDEETGSARYLSSSRDECVNLPVPDCVGKLEDEAGQYDGDECEATSSIYGMAAADAEPVDFENNGCFGSPLNQKMKRMIEKLYCLMMMRTRMLQESGGVFGLQIVLSVESTAVGKAQLLLVENLPIGEEGDKESWLEIIVSLSWEAATLLKPDTSKGGGMDPGGYVKVKCVACGRRSESLVIKGVVCKKNVAHRRMTSKIEKPRFLILGGALEYQRVENQLSSLDTLLQQEMEHLKMAVTKIDSQNPDVLLVEKSVSRRAQEYLLAKDISLVLNVKRSLQERVARCTGAQIVHSIDHLTSQKLGHCGMFHVEKFFEEHGSAGQGGKKLLKTLMFFEECPKPLGYTILLKGASGDELKKVKHAVHYGVFAAYHLAVETSFLADEGASLPEIPFNSPITVALPDEPFSVERSISTVPGFMVPGRDKPPMINNVNSSLQLRNWGKTEETAMQYTSERHDSQTEATSGSVNLSILTSLSAFSSSGKLMTNLDHGYSPYCMVEENNKISSLAIESEHSVGDQLFDKSIVCSDSENKNVPNSCGPTANEAQTDGMMVQGNRKDPLISTRMLIMVIGRHQQRKSFLHHLLFIRVSWFHCQSGVSGKESCVNLPIHSELNIMEALTSLWGDFYEIIYLTRLGKMVACFRYAPIDVHSVYLPPSILDFSYQHQDWIQKEADEVSSMAELLFSEVLNALRQIEERKPSTGSLNCDIKVPESRYCIVKLESLLQKEKAEFEEYLQKALKTEAKKGQPMIDVLEISKLRRQLLFVLLYGINAW